MLKFAIIGPATANTQDLRDAAEKLGHNVKVCKFSEIVFKTSENGFKAMCDNVDMCSFDVVIFRGYNDHIYEAQMLAQMLTEKGITIIEQSLNGSYVRGKVQQAKRLINAEINHPKTFQANNIKQWQEILLAMTFPIIAKPTMGRKGRGIQKLDDLQMAQDFFRLNNKEYLAQQYFPIISDYRILVVGDKVVGGFQRFINDGQYKSNIKGTRAEKIDVNEKMSAISLAAVKLMDYEISGVDLFEYENEFYILEVNVAPQWEKFKLVTGINPADHIIKYAVKKHENSNV